MGTMKTLCGVRVGNMKDPDPKTRGLVLSLIHISEPTRR